VPAPFDQVHWRVRPLAHFPDRPGPAAQRDVGEIGFALGEGEEEPDGDDLAEGELAEPEVVGGEVAVEELGHLQPL
jgi:hypothetical protein